MFSLAQFDYTLPPERIAHSPAEPRDSSRLLRLDRQTGHIAHHHFAELAELLTERDVIVRNNTKVLPARLFGEKDSGGKCEILLVRQLRQDHHSFTWECLTKPGLKLGQRIRFFAADAAEPSLTAECIEVTGFTRVIQFNVSATQFWPVIDVLGHTPVPPYIEWEKTDEHQLRQIYQTTYAKILGSVAAPTAGLHFTPELDERLRQKGTQIEEVTLHVGLGTFLPVKDEQLVAGKLHQEYYELSEDVARRLNDAKQQGKRIVAVGTTTTRVLETCSDRAGEVGAGSGETELFIQPGYSFKCVDALITNFHLPQSSLLLLVSAFASAPNTPHAFTEFSSTVVGQAYAEAIKQQYRFYSFGDAMLIE